MKRRPIRTLSVSPNPVSVLFVALAALNRYVSPENLNTVYRAGRSMRRHRDAEVPRRRHGR